MVSLYVIALSCIPILFNWSAVGLEIKNNACRNYKDYPLWFWSKNCYHNPNVLADTSTIIKAYGYPLQGYTVTTSDGYILTLLRIPARDNKKNKQPIYLQYGIFCSSVTWVFTGNRSLAFTLADEGYDVWLGSIRGTPSSKNHNKYQVTDREYWNFNLDTIANQDIREQLKFISNKTKNAGSIIYLGHSMGSTLAFMYASSEWKEAHDLLAGIIGLAPVAHFTDNLYIKNMFETAPNMKRLAASFQVQAIYNDPMYKQLNLHSCTFFPHVCLSSIAPYFGNISDHLKPDDLLLLVSSFPEAASVHVLEHFEQIIETDELRKFDFGKTKNLQIYGQVEPPKYDLKQIKMPVFAFYGKNDPLMTEKGLNKLFDELGSTKKSMQCIPKNTNEVPFNHVDFIIAKDLKKHLHSEILKILKEEFPTTN